MIIIVDDRKSVVDAFTALFEREGVAAMGMSGSDLSEWVASVDKADLMVIEAFLIGRCADRAGACAMINSKARSVVVAISEERCLDETLSLFAAGVDDVVRMPIHVKEILARINAVSRRTGLKTESANFGEIKAFFDGRDPEIGGEPLQLPRRERRILEFLANNVGRRVTKAQIFGAVYGLCNENIDETVIESHISKLRKRLRDRLGFDPIDCKRYLGYRLTHAAGECEPESVSPAQVTAALMSFDMVSG